MCRNFSRINSHVTRDTLANLNSTSCYSILYENGRILNFSHLNIRILDRPFVRITITVYLSAARTHSNLLAENSIKMQDWFSKGTQIKLSKIKTINMKLMKRMEFPRTGVFHGNRTRLLFVSFFFFFCTPRINNLLSEIESALFFIRKSGIF